MNNPIRTLIKQRSFETFAGPGPSRQLRVVFSPDQEAVGRIWSLELGESHIVGRGQSRPTSVADALVSSRHLRLSHSERGTTVEDLGSGNGTFLDGRRLKETSILTPTSVLSFGDTLAVVDDPPDPGDLPSVPGSEDPDLDSLVGISQRAEALRRSLSTVAPLDGAALLLGQTGVGKEVAARAVHDLGHRSGEFIAINCAAIPTEVAEAELFGHTAGAFSGAQSAREGYFVRAGKGTLFLDEVGDLAAPLQAKLLRVLEAGVVQPLGGEGREIPVDARVVAATNKDLWHSEFRSDLLARLTDWVVRIPSLVERRADILELWWSFERKVSGRLRPMTAEFAEALLLHDWPRNIRELRKLAHGICTLVPREDGLDLPALPPPMQEVIRQRFTASSTPIMRTVVEEGDPRAGPGREVLVAALRVAKGNVKQAALDNGWHRNQVYRWLKRLAIEPEDYR